MTHHKCPCHCFEGDQLFIRGWPPTFLLLFTDSSCNWKQLLKLRAFHSLSFVSALGPISWYSWCRRTADFRCVNPTVNPWSHRRRWDSDRCRTTVHSQDNVHQQGEGKGGWLPAGETHQVSCYFLECSLFPCDWHTPTVTLDYSIAFLVTKAALLLKPSEIP